MKDISVIVPVYNGEKQLESCFRSIYAAGERVAEIIFVDDGSTDNTLSAARRLADTDVRVRVIHTENHGCYAARLTGINNASSRYIAFADVDDCFCEGALDLLAVLLERYSADVAMGGYEETYNRSKKKPDKGIIKVRTQNSASMWRRIMKWKTQEFVCYVWNKLYKKELFKDFVYEEGINQGEDVLITCQAFIGVRKLVETTAPVYLYYKNPESLTHTGFGDGDTGLLRVWDLIVGIMKKRRPDLLYMAQFNRWRTDFTLITRLILTDSHEADQKYSAELKKWRSSLGMHWKELVFAHAMPLNRELLVIGLRFFFVPTRFLMRLAKKMSRKSSSELLHNGEKTAGNFLWKKRQ